MDDVCGWLRTGLAARSMKRRFIILRPTAILLLLLLLIGFCFFDTMGGSADGWMDGGRGGNGGQAGLGVYMRLWEGGI